MIIRKEIDFKQPLTEEQKQMLENLKTRPVEPDEDFPELTEEQLAKMKKISEIRREERKKQTVTLRLSPQALKTAKSLGKGYTSVLSRILESALTDEELIKQYL
ncbi:MAG: BrnA antitoxin family protein [Ruminococcus sp.]|nr:BrnA antitoxin family protein [Ruminococcus sp.]